MRLKSFHVARLYQVVAISTPLADQLGRVSKKTPIFHLPVYEVKLQMVDPEDPAGEIRDLCFHCDLADLTDLIDKLKSFQNQRKFFAGKNKTKETQPPDHDTGV